MKVAFLSGYPFTKKRFGVSQYVHELCCALARQHVECHVLSMHSKAESTPVYNNIWAHTVERRAIHYLRPQIAANELELRVEQLAPDIINLHGTTLPYARVACDCRKRYPVLATVHGDVVQESGYKSSPARLLSKLFAIPLMKKTLMQVQDILVLSSHMKNKVAQYTQGQVYVVPGGVDTTQFYVSLAVDSHASSYILFIGRLHRVKGTDLLLSALPQVIGGAAPFLVYLAGTGPEQRHLVRVAKKYGIQDRVKFLGHVSGRHKVELIQQAAFVVMPSWYESFGLVALEAMACGKPVVAARTGGLASIVRHRETGLLYDPGNVDQLTECLVELLLHPKLRCEYGRVARQVAESYSWSRIADQMIAVYRECIAQSGTGGRA